MSTVNVLEVSKSEDIGRIARGAIRAFFDHRGLVVQGWAAGHSSRAQEIEVVDDEAGAISRAPIDMARPDVAEAIGDSQAADSAGFRVVLEAHGSGVRSMTIRVLLADGSSDSLGHMRLKVAAPGVPLRERLRLRERSNGRTEGVTWSVRSTSGENEKVLRGNDGWLFLRGDSNDVIGQHTGRITLTRGSRRSWSRIIKQRCSLAKHLDVVWLCVVIPDKESVYPEYLPPEVKSSVERPVHQILDTAKRLNAPIIYSLSDLEQAKGAGELYPKTDTHWNHRGAYVVYQRICKELVKRGIEVSALDEEVIEWSDERTPGDLGGKIHPEPIESSTTRAKLLKPNGRLKFENGIRNRGQVWIFERDDLVDGPTCVVFGESFVGSLFVFLKETFRRVVVVHTSMFVREIVEAEAPDVVLSIPLERFMVRAPDDGEAFLKLASIAREKGGQLPWDHEDAEKRAPFDVTVQAPVKSK
jgi:hypothetical protein